MLGKVRKRIYSVDVFGNDKENKNGTFTDFRGIGLMIGIEFSEIRNKKLFSYSRFFLRDKN
jgi:4-aminobutyrate aminotransferase-like enzyme